MFDFETGGDIVRRNGDLDASRVVPIQIAGLAVDPRTLGVIEGSEFEAMMRPPAGTVLNQEALRYNKKTEEQVWAAPGDWEAVWLRFCDHVRKYRKGGITGRPIPAGKNIRNFDMAIVQWLCARFKQTDKDGTQNIFNDKDMVDIEDDLYRWFGHHDELKNMKMDSVRPYFGLPMEGAHDALVDVRQTALLIRKFFGLYRKVFPMVKFKGSCAASA